MSKYVSELFKTGEEFEAFLRAQIHSNREVLDIITQALVDAWNKKATAITVENGVLKLLDKDGEVLDQENIGIEDGSTLVRNSTTGALEVRGIRETNGNVLIKLWVGTQAQYDALATRSDTTKYWITDDATLQNTITKLNAVDTRVSNIENGVTTVPKAGRATNDTDGKALKTNYAYIGAFLGNDSVRLIGGASGEEATEANLDDYNSSAHCGRYAILWANIYAGKISGLPDDDRLKELFEVGDGYAAFLTVSGDYNPTNVFQTLEIRVAVSNVGNSILVYRRQYGGAGYDTWSTWQRAASVKEFEDGDVVPYRAKRAECDANGNSIPNTYATREAIIDGSLTPPFALEAKNASEDANGKKFITDYFSIRDTYEVTCTVDPNAGGTTEFGGTIKSSLSGSRTGSSEVYEVWFETSSTTYSFGLVHYDGGTCRAFCSTATNSMITLTMQPVNNGNVAITLGSTTAYSLKEGDKLVFRKLLKK